MSVATLIGAGNKKDAYDLFDRSYGLYCIFWGLNMGIMGKDDVKWIKTESNQKKTQKENEIIEEQEILSQNSGGLTRLKSWVKNAVNCCIE